MKVTEQLYRAPHEKVQTSRHPANAVIGLIAITLLLSACGFFNNRDDRNPIEENQGAAQTPIVAPTVPAATALSSGNPVATATRVLIDAIDAPAANQQAAVTNAKPAVLEEQALYQTALMTGWQNWSWEAAVDFSAASPEAQDESALAITFQAAWAALSLHSERMIDGRRYDLLRFQIHGGEWGNQKLRVVLADAGGAFQAQGLEITAEANRWQHIEVKLSTLGNLAQISGIAWQESTGAAQPTFYLKDIALVDIDLPPTPTPIPVAGAALTVDAATEPHAIDPNIYGINFADEELAEAVALPVRRWGGNGTTRYNWQLDVASHTKDWFFENIPKENANPALLPTGSQADLFVEQDRRTGSATLLTIPMIGWTPKSRAYACGFSVAKYGPQQEIDPWRSDCGNGIDPSGNLITGNDPTDTSVAIGPAFVEAWMNHLIDRFGTAANGGVAYYNLDNEPMLWHETHRDVHPEPVSYDELLERTLQYAATVKRIDPTAQTVGPALWGWTAYSYSALDQAAGNSWWNQAPDRKAHGGTALVPWYLAQMQAYEAANGVRLLDYLDLHYYPQAAGVALQTAGSEETQELRLRSTRSLWDPTYRDESWIDEPVQLIPRMRQWVDENYPGTKLAISEYNWGGLEAINGALAQADLLGIFGREGLAMAMLWDPLGADAPFAYAFRLYRNYDGKGSQFGDRSVAATSSDQEALAVYAARRSSDGALTVMVVNKSGQALRSPLQLKGMAASNSNASLYRYSADDLQAIVQLPDQPLDASGRIEMIFPAESITLVVIMAGQ